MFVFGHMDDPAQLKDSLAKHIWNLPKWAKCGINDDAFSRYGPKAARVVRLMESDPDIDFIL